MSIYLLLAAALIAMALYGILVKKSLVQKLICFNIFTSGIFLVFISSTYKETADPIAIALVLTGLVVALSATAFGLMLIRSLAKEKQ